MGWTVGDQLRQYSALTHNQLHSVAYQVRTGGIRKGEAAANMKVVDDRCRRAALLRTYKPDTPYTGQDKSDL